MTGNVSVNNSEDAKFKRLLFLPKSVNRISKDLPDLSVPNCSLCAGIYLGHK